MSPRSDPGSHDSWPWSSGLFALLAVNSVYLVVIRAAGWWTGETYENLFYLYMFLLHLVLGALIVVPVVVFGALHMRNAWNRPNRRAVRVGVALFVCALVLLASGVVLTRIEGVLVVSDPAAPEPRVLGPRDHAAGVRMAVRAPPARGQADPVGGSACAGRGSRRSSPGGMLVLQAQDPRAWNEIGNPAGVKYFFPSLARTLSGDFIPARILQNDEYCARCHADVHESWLVSAHRLSSFNNAPYLASVTETRAFAMERDGNVNASRFCAGCHDVVPFFSGQFNDPDYDMLADPTAHAGITCTACHAITAINSPRGNADYTIDVPIHYPFAFSDRPILQWINEQLVKGKPEFHKRTFLKPLHRTTELCGTCHKVHLPEELNDYKWLRAQNHQDAFWLSGVSGQGVRSFYYPPVAEESCNQCHMPTLPSEDFAARVRDESGVRKTLDHQFPSANTAVPLLAVDDGHLTAEQAAGAILGTPPFQRGRDAPRPVRDQRRGTHRALPAVSDARIDLRVPRELDVADHSRDAGVKTVRHPSSLVTVGIEHVRMDVEPEDAAEAIDLGLGPRDQMLVVHAALTLRRHRFEEREDIPVADEPEDLPEMSGREGMLEAQDPIQPHILERAGRRARMPGQVDVHRILERRLDAAQRLRVARIIGALVDEGPVADPFLHEPIELADAEPPMFEVLHDPLRFLGVAVVKLHDRADRPFQHVPGMPRAAGASLPQRVERE